MRIWASFLLLLTLPVAAQPLPADKPPEKASAKGMVIKAGTDEPVRRATIRLQGFEGESQKYQVITDAEGRFEIKDIEPGRYSLQVERDGFRVGRVGIGSAWTRSRERVPVVFSPGQKLDIVAYLIPGGVISGRVVDVDGEPVSKAQVQALRHAFIFGKMRMVPADQTRTDDLGEFRLHGLRAGSFYLLVTPGREWNSPPVLAAGGLSSKETLVYAPTFYPGVTARSDAEKLEIKSGQEIRANFSLVPVAAVQVRGRLTSTAPEPGLRVALIPQDEVAFSFALFRSNVEVQKDGTFQIDGVLPGSYTLMAVSTASQRFEQVASEKIEVGKTDISDLTLAMSPVGRATVKGRIRIEGNSSFDLTNVMVSISPDNDDGSGIFARYGRRGRGLGGVEADGAFEFEDVTDGTYRVEVGGRRGMGWSSEVSGLYLKSATVGKTDARDEGFTISEGRVAGPLEIVLSAFAAQIEGAVLDDQQKPVAGIRVVAAPEEKRRHIDGWYRADVTDQNGRFLMKAVRPGSYTMLALDSDNNLYETYDPELIKKFEDKGVNVTVKENDRKAIELKAIKVDEEQ